MGSQLLAAHNLLMGTANLLVLGLPEGWLLMEGYAHPEVDAWTEYQNRRWVSRGQGVYRLVEPHPGQPGLIRSEVELSVLATPSQVLAEGGEPFEVAGHPGVIFQATVPKGLWPRRSLPALKVEWLCPHTGRLLRLLVNGVLPAPLGREALMRLLEAIAAGVQCH
ncbi:MAG TPA: hypothetical protein VNT01_02700 [Symbiobacteriaceae bacterium]|nr:hypothetical protein [Symbiobacteriaceae bacterium]